MSTWCPSHSRQTTMSNNFRFARPPLALVEAKVLHGSLQIFETEGLVKDGLVLLCEPESRKESCVTASKAPGSRPQSTQNQLFEQWRIEDTQMKLQIQLVFSQVDSCYAFNFNMYYSVTINITQRSYALACKQRFRSICTCARGP